MEQLTRVFDFNGKNVRTATIEDETWFVAKDVCKILDIKSASDALRRLDDDEKGTVSNLTLGGKQKLSAVNESGLYELIFGSRKAEAREFRKWVTTEVLPSIRKDGMYVSSTATDSQKKYNYNMIESTFMSIGAEHVLQEYEACVAYHEANKTKLPYERKSKNRRSDKLRSIADSKEMILERLVTVLEAKSYDYRTRGQFELKSLVDEVCKQAILDLSTTRHNRTRGSLSYVNRITTQRLNEMDVLQTQLQLAEQMIISASSILQKTGDK